MYCKYCGQTNDDDAVFCSKCGKKLNGNYIPSDQSGKHTNPNDLNIQSNETKWISTENMQWEKYKPSVITIILIIFFSLSFLWGSIWIIKGGKKYENINVWSGRYYTRIKEPLLLNVWFYNYDDQYTSRDIIINENKSESFKNKATALFCLFTFLTYCFPSVIFFIIIFGRLKTLKKKAKDNLPRDIADYIESYEIRKLFSNKYVIFIKDGKYGIIDATEHKIEVPAQYNKIRWRVPSKSYDKE